MNLAELDAGFDPNPQANAGIFAEFYYYTSPDRAATLAEGRPIYKDYEYIRVRVAGDNSSILERPATAHDKQRFAAQYRRFKASETQKPDGFPLEEWPGITRAQVRELAHFNIFTVEQLAEVSDAHGQQLMTFQALKRKAAAYIAQLKDNAPFVKVQEELAARDAKIEQLTADLATVLEKLEEQQTKKGK